MAGIVAKLDNIDGQLKRLAEKRKALLQQKKRYKVELIDYMKKRRVDEIGGYELEALQGKPKPKLKPKAQRLQDVYHLMRDAGVNDPVLFWEMIQNAQRLEVAPQ